MKNLKERLKAMWMIAKADGFDVAVTVPNERGYDFWSMSAFGRDNAANALHNRIGDLFSSIHWIIKESQKKSKDEKDMQVPDDTVRSD